MSAMSALATLPEIQGMTADQMIGRLRELPESSSVSVAIIPWNSSEQMEFHTKLIVTNTPNGPAIFVGNSPLIPTTSTSALVQVLSQPIYNYFLSQPVRLLKQSDGFDMSINVSTYQLIISGNIGEDGEVKTEYFCKFKLENIMDNGTFATLVFRAGW